ncbi:hypothetical protein PVK06_042736 [Gossypium arboreum]|uniref:Uncharacterized protein n=1 Tax=Gossypium arboreum TaxID=29729 RepID=A0ABR0MP28_GOSAR|nr:hypothetical protein PVK06_042736 [Gossypium arboreum]
MTHTSLLNILTKNKMNGNNYNEWKRNLMIVLSCEKLKIVIDNKCLLTTQVEATKYYEAYDEIAHCYMLASVNNTFYQQLESCKTAKAIIDKLLDKLENMFGGQAILAQQSTITSLMNSQQKSDTPVKDHMIALMGYFVEATDNEFISTYDSNSSIF